MTSQSQCLSVGGAAFVFVVAQIEKNLRLLPQVISSVTLNNEFMSL